MRRRKMADEPPGVPRAIARVDGGALGGDVLGEGVLVEGVNVDDVLAEVADVWERSVRASHDFLNPGDVEAYRELLLGSGFGGAELYAVRDSAGRMLGFMGASADKIEMLFLLPELRGQGLGRALVEHAVSSLGLRRVDVNERNVAALGFYRRMGFAVVGRSELDSTGRPHPILHLELASEGP